MTPPPTDADRRRACAVSATIDDAAPLTADEVRAFLELCDAPAGLLYVHGWRYEHTDLTKSCAAKLRRIAGLPREGDL
jgi:hypothetical protein